MFNRKLGLSHLLLRGRENRLGQAEPLALTAKVGETVHLTCCLLPSRREQPPAATHRPLHNNGEHKISPAPAPHTQRLVLLQPQAREALQQALRCPLNGRWYLEPALPSILWSWGVTVSA